MPSTHPIDKVLRKAWLGHAAWPRSLYPKSAWRIFGIGLLLALGQLANATAQEQTAQPSASTIGKWVQELGDSQFDVRDQASAKLSKLSSDQLDYLRELLASSSDPEVVVRLSSVIAKLKVERQREIVRGFLRDTDFLNDHGLRGWSSFAKVAGASRSSKRLFLQLYDRYPELVEEPLEDPKQATEAGMKLLQRIQQEEVRRSEADKADGLALLYCTCASADNTESNLPAISLRILLRAPYNQCLRDPQSKRPIENMMELWTQNIRGSYEQATAIQVMLESNLSTAKSLAERMLKSYEESKKKEGNPAQDDPIDPKDIVRAFQVFFRFGKPEDLPILEKWLDNREVCEELVSLNFPGGLQPRAPIPGGNPNQERPMANVELRDVALLTCMQISGMDYRNHFPSVRQSPLWGFIPNSIALPTGSESIREARLEAWKAAKP